MKLKKAIGAIALIAILICGIYAAGAMYDSGTTYDGSKTDVIALYENPQEYDGHRRYRLPGHPAQGEKRQEGGVMRR